MILELTGLPTEQELAELESPLTLSMFSALFVKEHKRDFQSVLNTTDLNLIDLVKKCMVFDPAKRLTCEEVIAHPYFAVHHNKDKEPLNPKAMTQDVKFSRL